MIIAIIPAQSKSTRLPGKNMKIMLGKPMIDYTIEYAQDCQLIEEIYVSTDSEDIAEHARKKGVKVIMRPPGLCGDVAIVEVLKHCINNISNPEQISHVVVLQVDHPDRNVDLTDLIKLAVRHDIVDTITIGPDGIRNGSIRILRVKDLMARAISYSIMAVRDECTNIHYQEDFDNGSRNMKDRLNKRHDKKI